MDALELVLGRVLAHFEPLSTDEEARIWTAVVLGQATAEDMERLRRFFAPLAVQLAVQGFARRLGGYQAAVEGLVALEECLALYSPVKAGKVRFSLFLEAKLPQVLYKVVGDLTTDTLSLDAQTEMGTRYGELLAAPEVEADVCTRAEAALVQFDGITRRLLEGFVARKPIAILAEEFGQPVAQTQQALQAAIAVWKAQVM
jgi:hypothetical protein